MNQVSWLIYLADIFGNLSWLLVWAGIVVAIIAGAFFIQSCCVLDNLSGISSREVELVSLKKGLKLREKVVTSAFAAFAFWIAAALCPSQDTVLAIAASQFGEQLLHTKTASLAEQALNSWLEKQVTPAKKSEDK